MSSTYLVDDFAVLETIRDNLLKIRLFPFGQVVKNGIKRMITPEVAARFRLPHFKPALKLGSHAEATPAGGRIISLEIGDDGLYGVVEMTEQGVQAIADKNYHYHSPEVVWEDGSIENPDDGEPIQGPLIVGAALLHNPHLGEAAALFSVEPINFGGDVMSENTVTVPKTWYESAMALFGNLISKDQEPEPPKPQPKADEFEVKLQAERARVEELESQIAKMEAAELRGQRIAEFRAALPDDADVWEPLADLPPETAEIIVTRFKALKEQSRVNPDKDVGAAGSPEGGATSATAALNAAVTAYSSEHQVDYPTAFRRIQEQQPDLYDQYIEEYNARQGGE